MGRKCRKGVVWFFFVDVNHDLVVFFFSSRRRHTRFDCDWSSDVCSSDLMGLGPLMAIYQARFLQYLQGRGLAKTANRKVWAFMGDGEMDEPESLGAISLAGREHLDNLVFVINCNLQRLDGPVRGNGKIIQELVAAFRGAGG